MAGYLPFHDSNLMEMYRKIMRGSFRCPPWFPQDVRKLVTSLLDPNPETRITIEKVMEYPWFRKGFKRFEDPKLSRTSSTVSLSDVRDAFATPDTEKQDGTSLKVSRSASFNAFDLISLSQGFDLSGLFEKDSSEKMEARFTSTKSASALVTRLEEMASAEQSFRVERGDDGVVRLQGSKEGRKGQLGIDAEIIEVTPSFSILELKKTAGDTLEYKEFCDQALKPSLKDVARAWQESLPTVPEAQPV
ncbi:hypothetical protein MLD38_037097 [Melastoma candidum]|nr:hypothetical protein MLD38_037097 [Melastoma candidum]